MSKSKTKISAKKKQKSEGIPFVVLVSSIVGGLTGYIGGEIVFYSRPHPVHWTGILIGIVLGLLIGYLVYHKRGDII